MDTGKKERRHSNSTLIRIIDNGAREDKSVGHSDGSTRRPQTRVDSGRLVEREVHRTKVSYPSSVGSDFDIVT